MSEEMNEHEVVLPGDLFGHWVDLAIDDDEVGLDQIEDEYLRRLKRWVESQVEKKK